MASKYRFIFNCKDRVRRTKEDEAICFEKECPLCGKYKLIFKWDWTLRRYDPNSARCSGPECLLGNETCE